MGKHKFMKGLNDREGEKKEREGEKERDKDSDTERKMEKTFLLFLYS